MIPLSDASRRPTRFPAVTVALIALNVAAFGLELLGGDDFVLAWSATPAEIAAGRGWVTLFTAMFLHGGVMHLLGNMVFFWAFAPGICNQEASRTSPTSLALCLVPRASDSSQGLESSRLEGHHHGPGSEDICSSRCSIQRT